MTRRLPAWRPSARRASSWAGFAALTVALAALALASGTAAATPPGTKVAQQNPSPLAVLVAGTVVDHETRRPIEGAEVRLSGDQPDSTGNVFSETRVSDEDGQFAFLAVLPGPYHLGVTRIGYRTLEQPLDVAADALTELVAEMVPVALDLDPVLVTVTRPIPHGVLGIDEALDTVFGVYIGRDEINGRAGPRISDLLRTVPGVRIQRAEVLGDLSLTLRSGCTPAIFLDGVETFSIAALDATVLPADLDAVQVFRGTETPVVYRSNNCGAIALWTRGRDIQEGHGAFWKRILFGAAFASLAFLILR